MAEDLTIEILKQIRDGVLGTNQRVDGLTQRVDALAVEMSGLKSEMTELRTEMAGANLRLDRVDRGLNDLGGFMKQIALDQTRHERFHAQHVQVLERDVEELKARVQKLESESGRKDA